MKNGIKGFICGVLTGVILVSGIVSADTLYNVLTHGVKIVVDGKKINPTDANGNPVEPIIYNGTTYLPVRAVANAFGKEVYWDGPNYTVYLGKKSGQLQYPSLYLKDAVNVGDYLSWSNFLTDNYGNTYDSAAHTNNGWGATAEYILNMKYTRFTGTIAVEEGSNTQWAGKVSVKADGKTIYSSPEILKNTAPIKLDLNITGCNVFEIEFSGDVDEIHLADAGFYQ